MRAASALGMPRPMVSTIFSRRSLEYAFIAPRCQNLSYSRGRTGAPRDTRISRRGGCADRDWQAGVGHPDDKARHHERHIPPHSFEEVSELVAPEAAARLDPHKRYGIQWYNRQRVKVRTVSEPDGGRRCRQERTFRWRPREEWIAIPVPACLPRELVDQARAVVGSGRARARKHLTRGWELRGMMRCGCGRKMGTRTAEFKGRLFYYYVCRRSPATRKVGECAQRCVRATHVEDAVWRFVSSLLKDPNRIRAGIEKLIEQECEVGRSDPEREVIPWEEKIAECSRLRSAYQDQQAAGLMTLEELASKLARLEETRRVAEAELKALEAREERLRELETDRDALIASYAERVPEALDRLSAEERTRVYRMLRLEVRPDLEGYEVSGTL